MRSVRSGAAGCVTLAGLAVFLSGCGAAPHTAATATTRPLGWPAAAAILDGFEIGPWGSAYHVGDRLLFGLRSTRDGVSTTRYLLVELTGDVDDKTVRVARVDADNGPWFALTAPPTYGTKLQTFDAEGKLLHQAVGQLPARPLAYGLWGFLPGVGLGAATQPTPRTLSRTEAEALAYASATLDYFAAGSGSNRALASLLAQVAERPSLFELLRGLTLSAGWTNIAASRASLASTEVDALLIDLTLTLNNRPALLVRATVVRSAPPLGLASGLVRATGVHPTDPTRQLTVELLAARRGSGRAFETFRIGGPDQSKP